MQTKKNLAFLRRLIGNVTVVSGLYSNHFSSLKLLLVLIVIFKRTQDASEAKDNSIHLKRKKWSPLDILCKEALKKILNSYRSINRLITICRNLWCLNKNCNSQMKIFLEMSNWHDYASSDRALTIWNNKQFFETKCYTR